MWIIAITSTTISCVFNYLLHEIITPLKWWKVLTFVCIQHKLKAYFVHKICTESVWMLNVIIVNIYFLQMKYILGHSKFCHHIHQALKGSQSSHTEHTHTHIHAYTHTHHTHTHTHTHKYISFNVKISSLLSKIVSF